MYILYSSHYSCSPIYVCICMRPPMNDFWLRLEECQHLGQRQRMRLSRPLRASALLQTTDDQLCRNPLQQQLISSFYPGAFINKWFNCQRRIQTLTHYLSVTTSDILSLKPSLWLFSDCKLWRDKETSHFVLRMYSSFTPLFVSVQNCLIYKQFMQLYWRQWSGVWCI